MKLEKYLERIGFAGEPHANLETLRSVHRGHIENIPYENLDVQFGAPVSRDPQAAFDKIVNRRRGGWCFEMNGLLSWALEEIGFKVRRLAGAVDRANRGDAVIGNHLVLLVDLDETWIADAGFGDGLIEPARLADGPFSNGPYQCGIENLGDGWRRYLNDERGGAPSFDFNESVSDEALLERMCRLLQTDAESPFVQNAVVQRWINDEHLSLRGRVFVRTTKTDRETRLISDAEEYVKLLRDEFALDLPEAAGLWPKIVARHIEVFGAEETAPAPMQ